MEISFTCSKDVVVLRGCVGSSTTVYVKSSLRESRPVVFVLLALGVVLLEAVITADGVNVFQSGYAVVLRMVLKTREAGALMRVDAEIVNVVALRGTWIVVRPVGGGQREKVGNAIEVVVRLVLVGCLSAKLEIWKFCLCASTFDSSFWFWEEGQGQERKRDVHGL